jgi:hypothetical protein
MRNAVGRFRAVLGVTLLAGVFGAAPAMAQGTAQTAPPPPQNQGTGPHEGLGIQLIGGGVFANLTDITGVKTESRTGYLVGLAMGGNRGGTVGVEADVLYGKKGATINGKDFDVSIVHVPVMLKVNVGSKNVNGLSFFGVGGGFFDWQFDSTDIPNISKDTKGYEVGYVLGGGVEFFRFSVQARYIRGVKQIDRTFALAAANDSNTQAFAVLFAFRLN